MGKLFGILALLIGLISLILLPVYVLIFNLPQGYHYQIPYGLYIGLISPILAIILGIFGIVKDDSKAFGIVGMVLGMIGLIGIVFLQFIGILGM